MSDPDRPQLYLVTPPAFELETFVDRLARVLDGAQVACLRLSVASRDEALIGRAADALREVAHQRDIPIVVEGHIGIAQRHGLDGVHLPDAARSIRAARKTLGDEAIVGAFCGASRHDGMNAGEAGADYVSFGPVGASALGTGTVAGPELFAWWTEMIEVPVVAEGGLTLTNIGELAGVTDFLAIGEEIWREQDALSALRELTAPLA